MKIAILSCFYPYRGGISQFNASLFNELGKAHDVKAFNFSRQYPEFLFPGKTQYVTPEDEAVPVESETLLDTANPFTWARTARAIRQWGPDLLLLRYWMPYFAPSLGYVARHMAKGCKVVGILDNVVPHERHIVDKPLTSYMVGALDGAVTLCSEVASDLRGFSVDLPCTVLPHPVYSHFGEAVPRAGAEALLGLESGKRNLLFFGLIREYKGLDILLQAFDLLGPEYQLIIAGEPYGSFDRYSRLIEASPGRDRIHVFPEYVRDSGVSRFFSVADVTVLPYRSATQSGISSISYHFGVPMIVTDAGGLRETIGERGTGIVCSEAAPGPVARAIEEYFSTEGLRERLSANIEKEKDRLSWSRFAANLTEFAEKL